MNLQHLLPLVPFLAMLAWTAIEDIRSRRIRNWMSFSIILSGLLQSALPGRHVTPWESILGLMVGFSLPFILFALGAVGGGDVKLLAGVGAWVGPLGAFEVFCAEAIIGMIIVLAQAAAQGRLRVLTRNSAMLALNLAHVNELGIEHTAATGQSCRSVDRPLPYAVPVLLAVVALLAGLLP